MASFLSSPAALPTPLPKPQFTCSSPPRPLPSPPPLPPPSSQQSPSQPPLSVSPIKQPRPKPTPAESTDWIASALTRRFGLGAGLAWAALLAAGVVSEQIKTRIEASEQESNTKDVEDAEEIALPNGIRYSDLRIGGGAAPRSGNLVVIDLKGRVLTDSGGGEEVFVDTFRDGKRPLALVMGSRPYTRGMCDGVEYVLRSMRTGGKRRVVVPPELGFGDEGADFGGGERIPPAAALEFIVQVDKVSIAPS